MLLERSFEQRDPNTNDEKTEATSFDVAAPQFLESKQPLSPIIPASPHTYFGNQVQAKLSQQNFDNLRRPKTPTTPRWVYQSTGLNSEIEANNCYSPLIRMRLPLPNQIEQSFKQEKWDYGDAQIPSPYFKLDEITPTSGRYKENVHPGGGSRISNMLRPTEQRLSDRKLTRGKLRMNKIKPGKPTSADNNAHHGEGKQSHKEVLKYIAEKSGVGMEEYTRDKRYARSLRKRYSSDITTKDLNVRMNKIKPVKPTSADNNSYPGEGKQYHIEALKYTAEESGVGLEEYTGNKRYTRSLRKRYSSGISAKDLKLRMNKIKPGKPTSVDNNPYHGERKQSDKEALRYRAEKSGVVLDDYARNKRYAPSLRKRYKSGISAKDLKLFTKNIGFKSSTDGTHNYICELVDYVIDSKLVYRASACPRGSKFLQHQIINANWVDRDGILEQVMEKLVTICNDNYGNYVVQCFFMLSNPDIEKEILLKMKGSLCMVAMNQYGCRVLQKAIPTLNDELFQIVIDALARNTYMLALHNFGCHVLQRAIERGTGQVVRVLMLNLTGSQRTSRLVELSKDCFGCRIIQRMLEQADFDDRETIIQGIIGSPRDLLALCMDEFGNYVIQCVLEHNHAEHSMALMEVLDGRLLKMAKNKFCSNVLEVLYKRGGRDVEDRLIKQVDVHFLKECLNDRFANYLVQTMLTEGEPENRAKIRSLLKTIPDLKDLKFGIFVIYRLCRLNKSLAK